MSLEKSLDRLNNDADYYGEYGSQWLSNSSIGMLLNNPAQFGREQEKTLPMLQGGYFHTYMLEPEKLNEFTIMNVGTRSTKAFKEHIAENNLKPYDVLLQKEVDELERLANIMKGNFDFYERIYAEGNQYEVPATMELFGLPWKGKADIVAEDCLIDIKTTSDIDKFRYSAKAYNYDSQAYIYEALFGKPMMFYVICKKSSRLGVFQASPDFLLGGRQKVQAAVEAYNKYFSESATEDPSSFFINEIL